MPTPSLARGPHRIQLTLAIHEDTKRALAKHLGKPENMIDDETVLGFYKSVIDKSNSALKERYLGQRRILLPNTVLPDPDGMKPVMYKGVKLNR